MTIGIIIWLSGFLFLFIIITNILSTIYGYKTFSDMDTDGQLQNISNDPTKFKISFILIVSEHIGIIVLAMTLYIAFSRYNLILGIIWCLSRVGEGSIQVYNKRKYWRLLNIASEYLGRSAVEKKRLNEITLDILKSKNRIFSYAQILFSIGTFSYSILFVIYGVVPIIIGWFGLIASIIYGLGNIIYNRKKDFKVIWGLGGVLIFVFELVLGIWLLIFV